MIFLSMLLLGTLIGFVGAGGAGVTITLLTVGFNIPIHIALGVALSSTRSAACPPAPSWTSSTASGTSC